jgi:hypothetical protein
MNFIVTHTYREGNIVADLIANFGLSAPLLTSWDTAHMFISDALERNKLGLPCLVLGFVLLNGDLVWSPPFIHISLLSLIYFGVVSSLLSPF